MIYRCGGYVGLLQSSYQVLSKQVMSVSLSTTIVRRMPR